MPEESVVPVESQPKRKVWEIWALGHPFIDKQEGNTPFQLAQFDKTIEPVTFKEACEILYADKPAVDSLTHWHNEYSSENNTLNGFSLYSSETSATYGALANKINIIKNGVGVESLKKQILNEAKESLSKTPASKDVSDAFWISWTKDQVPNYSANYLTKEWADQQAHKNAIMGINVKQLVIDEAKKEIKHLEGYLDPETGKSLLLEAVVILKTSLNRIETNIKAANLTETDVMKAFDKLFPGKFSNEAALEIFDDVKASFKAVDQLKQFVDKAKTEYS